MLVLFEDGIRVGEVSEWKRTERFAEKKVVLGKEIVTQKPKDQCEFVSPKPVNRKKSLWLIADGKKKIVLSEIKVKAGTFVTATIAEEKLT